MPSDTPSSAVKALFLDHPASVDETYFQHMGVALRFAFLLALAAMAALVHAFIPGACEKTASQIIRRLHDRMSNRG